LAEPAGAPIRIFVCAEIRLYREGLAHVLAATERIVVAGTASSAAEASKSLAETGVDVLLIDLSSTDAFAAVSPLHAANREAKILAIAVPELADEILARAEAGIEGYVTRDASIDDLVRAIEGVHRGELICSPSMAGALLRHVGRLAGGRRSTNSHATLTPRQRQIAALVGDGLSNKEIARKLSIELPTVKNHVHSILEKLDVHRRSEIGRVLSRY
jgi:two-component system, NarL family, nitrate/nitrite response regulator NarL